MPEYTLTKATRLLERNHALRTAAAERFVQSQDSLTVDLSVSVPRDLYDELGEPDTITVTVQPGDHLN